MHIYIMIIPYNCIIDALYFSNSVSALIKFEKHIHIVHTVDLITVQMALDLMFPRTSEHFSLLCS